MPSGFSASSLELSEIARNPVRRHDNDISPSAGIAATSPARSDVSYHFVASPDSSSSRAGSNYQSLNPSASSSSGGNFMQLASSYSKLPVADHLPSLTGASNSVQRRRRSSGGSSSSAASASAAQASAFASFSDIDSTAAAVEAEAELQEEGDDAPFVLHGRRSRSSTIDGLDSSLLPIGLATAASVLSRNATLPPVLVPRHVNSSSYLQRSPTGGVASAEFHPPLTSTVTIGDGLPAGVRASGPKLPPLTSGAGRRGSSSGAVSTASFVSGGIGGGASVSSLPRLGPAPLNSSGAGAEGDLGCGGAGAERGRRRSSYAGPERRPKSGNLQPRGGGKAAAHSYAAERLPAHLAPIDSLSSGSGSSGSSNCSGNSGAGDGGSETPPISVQKSRHKSLTGLDALLQQQLAPSSALSSTVPAYAGSSASSGGSDTDAAGSTDLSESGHRPSQLQLQPESAF